MAILVIIFTSSCKDYLDINTDPNNPTEPRLPLLLTNAEINIGNAVGHGSAGISSILGVYVHQIVVREEADKYETNGSSFAIGTTWNQFYTNALEDLRVIIEEGQEAGEMDYVGIAKILKAYAFSSIVDLWGDVPFVSANNMPEVRFPEFDDDEQIYPQIVALIDEGIADLEAEDTGVLSVDTDDLIYEGDKSLWIKAANTIKLKLYNQQRLVKDVSSEVNELLANGELIEDIDEDFELPYGQSTNPDNRNPGFLNDYNSANKTIYISPWFYETMQGMRDDIFNGIVDPRIPYYWYNQLEPSEDAQNPTEYRDGAFVSIYFGSTGPDRDHAQDESQTVIGLYPVGGKFDDNSGEPVEVTDGPADVPQRLITYMDRLFIEAELAHNNLTDADPKEKLEDAIRVAFYKVNEIADNAGAPLIEDEDTDVYVNNILNEYDNANNTKKLEIIMTQKWIAGFGNALETYNDYRRTGFPEIYDPNEDDIPFTIITRGYPLSLPYPQGDLELNPNSPPQKNITQARVFWDPN